MSRQPEQILICGWRRDFGDLIKELDLACEKGTEVSLMSTAGLEEREVRLSENGRTAHKNLQNISLIHYVGDPTVKRNLEKLPVEIYETIIVVPDEKLEADSNAADGRTIVTVLLLRESGVRDHSKRSSIP